jgi:DNA-binding transcriptional MerR regulator
MNDYSAIGLAPAGDQGADDFRAAAEGETVYTIGELTRRFDLTHRALRFYESRGLLNPVRRGSSRVYGVKDVERLTFIVKAKKLGLTLTAIGQILRDADSGQTLRLSRETCVAQIAALERKLAQTLQLLIKIGASAKLSAACCRRTAFARKAMPPPRRFFGAAAWTNQPAW